MANEGWNKSGGFGGGYLQRKFFPRTAMLSTGFALAVSVSSAQVLPALAQSRVEGYQYPPRVAIQTEPQDGWLYTASYTPPPVFDPVQGVAPAAQLTQYRVKTCSRFLPDTDRDAAWQYVVTRPKIATLVDDFNQGQVTTRWESVTDTGSTVSFTNQRLEIQPPSSQASPAVSYGSALARDAYDLSSSSIYLELLQPSQGTPLDNAGTGLQLSLNRNNRTDNALAIAIYPNFTYFAYYENGVYTNASAPLAYSAVNHRWLRIRHDGSQVQWDTSANGTDWTNRASWTPTFPITALYAELYAGVDDTTASPTAGILDNVNTPPSFIAATSSPDTVRPKAKRAIRQTDQPQDGWLYTAQPAGDVWDASKFQGQVWDRGKARKQRSVLYDFHESAFGLFDARTTSPAYAQLLGSYWAARSGKPWPAGSIQDTGFVYSILPVGDVWSAAKFQNNESQRLRDRNKSPLVLPEDGAWLYTAQPVLDIWDASKFQPSSGEWTPKRAALLFRYPLASSGFGTDRSSPWTEAQFQNNESQRLRDWNKRPIVTPDDMGWLYQALPVVDVWDASKFQPFVGERTRARVKIDSRYEYYKQSFAITDARKILPAVEQLANSFRTDEKAPYLYLPSEDIGWLYANLPTFNPALFIQGQSSFRTNSKAPYRASADTNIGWLYAVTSTFDPALFIQSQPSLRTPSRSLYRYATSEDMGWLYATLPVVFDPQYLIHVVDDQIARARRRAPQNDQPSQAWIYANLPAFNPAFFIQGQPSFRTDEREELELAYQAWVNDLSWLHDVLGLVDTPFVPGTVYQRPIAPIMSARRRRRR